MARNSLTNKMVASLKPRASQYTHADPHLPGHYVRVSPSGNKSFVVVARDPSGKQIWFTIGATTLHTIEAAREIARDQIRKIKSGADRAGPETFSAIAEGWLKHHVEKKGLRTGDKIRRTLAYHVLPAWGGRDFASIRRGDVAKLLDKVESSGPVMADSVLHIVSGICSWYATRNDSYVTPICKGMRRTSPKERARSRILSDDELRAVWNECHGTFGAFVKLALLTAQRREKVCAMRWEDISDDGVWTIPSEAREKGNAKTLPLPEAALKVIRSRPRLESNPFVIAGRTTGPVKNLDRGKAAMDAELKLAPWTLHDLRRTARSLMARAGVLPHVAELTLGHVQHGVQGVYDRHDYTVEKGQALAALAGLLATILDPRPNVVPMKRKRT
jgi:integrase